MSEKDVKKPGARDISDLKARLGLKKGADGTAGRPGAVPPPGAKAGAVPPPPGIAPPPGMAPAVPDARVDPFAAMNAMAAQGAQVAAPQQIVITAEDSKLLKAVHTKSKLGWLKLVAPALVALVLGFLVGGISYSNKAYNQTIDDAKVLTEQVRDVGKTLEELRNTLLLAKERGPDKQSFLPGDKDLTESLKALNLAEKKPDRAMLFHSNLYNMDPLLVEDTLTFYSDLYALYERIDRHIRISEADAKKAPKKSEALEKLGARGQFGVVFNMPQGENAGPPTVDIVEIGSPVCSDRKGHPEGCGGAPPIGFEYRPDPASTAWGQKAWSPSEIKLDGIALVNPNVVLSILLSGSEPFIDQLGYMERVKEIDAMTTAIVEAKRNIENRMNQKAQESKQFSL